jgi:Tfp pilus assembly protein PilZ
MPGTILIVDDVEMFLEILTEDGTMQVQAKAVVRWRNSAQGSGKACSPDGFGVEFTAFAGDSLANLNRYLAQFSS